MASNSENSSTTVGNNLPQEHTDKPTDTAAEKAVPATTEKHTKTSEKAEKGHSEKPERASRSNAAPPAEGKSDTKPSKTAEASKP